MLLNEQMFVPLIVGYIADPQKVSNMSHYIRTKDVFSMALHYP